MFDTLAEKVRVRRAEAASTVIGPSDRAKHSGAEPSTTPYELVTSVDSTTCRQEARDTALGDIGDGDGHLLTSARVLPGGAGLRAPDIAGVFDTGAVSVSKRLAVFKASPTAQQQVNSKNLAKRSRSKDRRRAGDSHHSRRFQQIPTLTISLEAGRTLAELLQILAQHHDVNPIHLGARAAKKDLIEILNYRSTDIRRLVK